MWTDYSLVWNVSEFGGIRVVRIPADKVWKSDIILYNKYVTFYDSSRDNNIKYCTKLVARAIALALLLAQHSQPF